MCIYSYMKFRRLYTLFERIMRAMMYVVLGQSLIPYYGAPYNLVTSKFLMDDYEASGFMRSDERTEIERFSLR